MINILYLSPFPRFLRRNDMSCLRMQDPWPFLGPLLLIYRVPRCSAGQIYRGSSLDSERLQGPIMQRAFSPPRSWTRVSQPQEHFQPSSRPQHHLPTITLAPTRRWMPLYETRLANSAFRQDSPLPSRQRLTAGLIPKPGQTPLLTRLEDAFNCGSHQSRD
jgi:hypothetical protein